MKNNFLFLLFGIITSCDYCDDEPQDDSIFFGTYVMKQWNAPEPLDLNSDGIASRNLMVESGCYQGTIVLNPDHTFIIANSHATGPIHDLKCVDIIESGTWTRSGTNLWLTGVNGIAKLYSYGTVNQILTRSETFFDYPTISGNQTGPVSMVYSKL